MQPVVDAPVVLLKQPDVGLPIVLGQAIKVLLRKGDEYELQLQHAPTTAPFGLAGTGLGLPPDAHGSRTPRRGRGKRDRQAVPARHPWTPVPCAISFYIFGASRTNFGTPRTVCGGAPAENCATVETHG